MPYRYFIRLAFDGSSYNGWQTQPNAKTVQAELESALSLILRHPYNITGCGRTDTGVHSLIYYAHFDSVTIINNLDSLVFRLNSFLPSSVSIDKIAPVKAGVHARFTAVMREYTYTISRKKDPFRFQYCYFHTSSLDIEVMNKGAEKLLQHSDFQSFSKVRTQVANFICSLKFARWYEEGDNLKFIIRSDRFLRNMVRSIVGTLLDLGKHKISLDDLDHIIQSHDRRRAGRSVPAKGLMLTDVRYPDGIFADFPEWFSEDSFKEIESHNKRDSDLHQRAGKEADE